MFTVKKYIIGLIIGTMIFSGIALVDDLIIKISMGAAASLAFSIVGSLYSAGLITSKAEGGKARLYIFVILLGFFLYVFTQIAKGIIWLFSFPTWIYIVIISSCAIILVIFMIVKNKKAKERYTQLPNLVENTQISNQEKTKEVIEKPSQIIGLKTIPELLNEENDNDFIIATSNNPNSPGLQYVKVYKKALSYSKIQGYIKMDHATAFWGDVFYAYDKRWIKY
jgi:hypothetical protein